MKALPTPGSAHAIVTIRMDTDRDLIPSELEELADRLEQARATTLADRVRTPRGPAVVVLGEGAGG